MRRASTFMAWSKSSMTLIKFSFISSIFPGCTSPLSILSVGYQHLPILEQVTAYQNGHIWHSHTKMLKLFPSLWTSTGWSSPRHLFLHQQSHLQPCLQITISAGASPKFPLAFGWVCSVPVWAKQSGISSASDISPVRTNLKRDLGNTECGLCNVIQLRCVKVLLVSLKANWPLWMQPCIWWPSPNSSPSICPSVGSNHLATPQVYGGTSTVIPPMWMSLAGCNAQSKRQMVGSAENCSSREQLCFPMVTSTAVLN